jgi:hypothetical protein
VLNLNPELVSFLAAKGLIAAEKRQGRGPFNWAIGDEAMRAFKATYITVAGAAREMGLPAKTLNKILDGRGLKPCSGPSIDGGYQNIIRRDVIESLKQAVRGKTKAPATGRGKRC